MLYVFFKKQNKTKTGAWAQWRVPVAPASWKTVAGGWLERGRSTPTYSNKARPRLQNNNKAVMAIRAHRPPLPDASMRMAGSSRLNLG